MPLLPSYPLDLTNSALSNRITDEIHTFNTLADRMFVPSAGPFYTQGLVVSHPVTGVELQADTHYKLLHLHKEAALQSGKNVCCIVYVHNPAIPGCKLNYQVIGGTYSDTADVIREILNNLPSIPSANQVHWGQLIGQPVQYPPAAHRHHVDSLYNMGDVVNVLEQIRTSMLAGDAGAFEAIYQYINNLFTNVAFVTGTDMANEVNARSIADTRIHGIIKNVSKLNGYGIASVMMQLYRTFSPAGIIGMLGYKDVQQDGTVTIGKNAILSTYVEYQDDPDIVGTNIPNFAVSRNDYVFTADRPVTVGQNRYSVFAMSVIPTEPTATLYYPNNLNDVMPNYHSIYDIEFVTDGPFAGNDTAGQQAAINARTSGGYTHVADVLSTYDGDVAWTSSVQWMDVGKHNPVLDPTAPGQILMSTGAGNRNFAWHDTTDLYPTTIGLNITHRGNSSHLGLVAYGRNGNLTDGKCYINGVYTTIAVGDVVPLKTIANNAAPSAIYNVFLAYNSSTDSMELQAVPALDVPGHDHIDQLVSDVGNMSEKRYSMYSLGNRSVLFLGVVAAVGGRWITTRSWFQDTGFQSHVPFTLHDDGTLLNQSLVSTPTAIVKLDSTYLIDSVGSYQFAIDTGTSGAAMIGYDALLWRGETVDISANVELAIINNATGMVDGTLQLAIQQKAPNDALFTSAEKKFSNYNINGQNVHHQAAIQLPFVAPLTGLYHFYLKGKVTNGNSEIRLIGDGDCKSTLSMRLSESNITMPDTIDLTPVPANNLTIVVDEVILQIVNQYMNYKHMLVQNPARDNWWWIVGDTELNSVGKSNYNKEFGCTFVGGVLGYAVAPGVEAISVAVQHGSISGTIDVNDAMNIVYYSHLDSLGYVGGMLPRFQVKDILDAIVWWKHNSSEVPSWIHYFSPSDADVSARISGDFNPATLQEASSLSITFNAFANGFNMRDRWNDYPEGYALEAPKHFMYLGMDISADLLPNASLTLTLIDTVVLGQGGSGGMYIDSGATVVREGMDGRDGITSDRSCNIILQGRSKVGGGGGGGGVGRATSAPGGLFADGGGGGGGMPFGPAGDYQPAALTSSLSHSIGYAGGSGAIYPSTTGGMLTAADSYYGASIWIPRVDGSEIMVEPDVYVYAGLYGNGAPPVSYDGHSAAGDRGGSGGQLGQDGEDGYSGTSYVTNMPATAGGLGGKSIRAAAGITVNVSKVVTAGTYGSSSGPVNIIDI